MGLWVALEDATQDNGCLWFIPRSHSSTLSFYWFISCYTRVWVIKGYTMVWVMKGYTMVWVIKGYTRVWVIKGDTMVWVIKGVGYKVIYYPYKEVQVVYLKHRRSFF